MVGPEHVEVVLEEVTEEELEEALCQTFPDHGDTNEVMVRLYSYWSKNTWLLWNEHDTN